MIVFKRRNFFGMIDNFFCISGQIAAKKEGPVMEPCSCIHHFSE